MGTVGMGCGALFIGCWLAFGGCLPAASKGDDQNRVGAQADRGPGQTKPSGAFSHPPLARADFNRLAALMDLPLFWARDQDKPGSLQADELVVLGIAPDRSRWVNKKGQFTARLQQVVGAMVERRRQEALARELDQGLPTLVHTDMRQASEQDKTIVRHITRAARIVEELFAQQTGAAPLMGCSRPGDSLSRALLRRNQGPWCRAPETESDPFCNACSGFPAERSGLYPSELQAKKDFCQILAEAPREARLLDHFTVVVPAAEGPGYEAVPYHQFYADRVHQVAEELRAASAAISTGEGPFKAYLEAAARAFETDDWPSADEAWVAMNASNSKWYLRIGADEVYYEPCNQKAGYHVSFALIDPDSAYWQQKLTPLRDEMENRLAGLIGEAYQARQVSVHMPDFIAIVLNAGDDRSPMGATIGQSLPNWGKVATEGRSRTVVMSNLYTDPDSRAISRSRAESLLSPEAMQRYTEDQRLGLLDIVLHEATHNFGPHSDFQVKGKRPTELFGGPLATVLEELKAQTGALYFIALLEEKGVLSTEDAQKVYLHAINWACGHISRGMFDGNGRPKPYSHVAGVQLAFLVDQGVIAWQPAELAANGQDKGRFQIDFAKFAPAVEKLMAQVGRIKASGDRAAAAALIDPYVKGDKHHLMHQATIAERILRQPKASFIYAISF